MNLRTYAKGQDCLLRLPGICNRNPETTVLCHIKRGWHASLKPPDIIAVWGCSNCHDVIDRRRNTGWNENELDAMILTSLVQQLDLYVKDGILKW